jgi:hypothetical protein
MHEWQLRPAGPEDHVAVVAITDAQDLAYRGQTDFTLEALRDQILADSTVDAERDLVVIELAGTVVAYGLFNGRSAFTGVHPEHENPELQAELIGWAEKRQSELGRRPYRGGADAVNAPAVAAWVAAGYSLEHVYAQMVRTFAESGAPEPAELRDGYRLRPTDRDIDAAALWELDERRFCGGP